MKPQEFKGKKAQAAMEFLSTYGWAVLIIALVLVAIAWLGVFGIPWQVQDRCTFPIGTLNCHDAKIVYSNVGSLFGDYSDVWDSLTVTNKFDKTITLHSIRCSAEPTDPQTGLPLRDPPLSNYVLGTGSVIALTPSVLYPNQQATIRSTASPGPACYDAAGRTGSFATGTKYVGKIYIEYSFPGDTTGKARILTGDIVATVQAG